MGFGLSVVVGSYKIGAVLGSWVDTSGILVLLFEENGESESVPMHMYSLFKNARGNKNRQPQTNITEPILKQESEHLRTVRLTCSHNRFCFC